MHKKLINILLLDGYQISLAGLKLLIESKSSFVVCGVATSVEDAIEMNIKHAPNIILIESDFDSGKGIEIISKLLEKGSARVIVLAEPENDDLHDQAVIKGARGVLKKTDSPENLIKAIEKVHEGELWVNRDATSRILMQIAQANRPKALTTEQIQLQALTPKEVKVVLALTANSDKPLREISALLHISEHTLRNHLASIYDKLSVKSRLELYVYGKEHMSEAA